MKKNVNVSVCVCVRACVRASAHRNVLQFPPLNVVDMFEFNMAYQLENNYVLLASI